MGNAGKSIYNFCPYIYYSNDQILKDCCLVPYMFYRTMSYRPVIVTACSGNYSNMAAVPGLELEFLPKPEAEGDKLNCEEWIQSCCHYLSEHYQEIDVLFCFGTYPLYTRLVPLYKQLRPDGRVLLKLDANLAWTEKIEFTDRRYAGFLQACDVITCESKKIKKYLSRKWPMQIDYMVNGTPDFIKKDSVPYEDKENVILTVCRLGTEQKATDVLLNAFRKVADKLPDWKLKLVGSVEPSFKPYISMYFARNPELLNRVVFTGRIEDKEKLELEYRKAKIFALTSKYEGGTPNVWAEAARNNCYMVCSDIDASGEATGFGECGRVFEIGNVNQLADIFLEVCQDDYSLEEGGRKAREFHDHFFLYEKAVYKLNLLMSQQNFESIETESELR